MQKENMNLTIKGFVFKKFPMELKVVFIISVIVNIIRLVLAFLSKRDLGNKIFSIGMFFFLGYWIFYYLTKRKELKIENGNLYFNKENVILKGYKVEYGYGNKIYLKTQNESFLFFVNSGIFPSKNEKIYLQKKVMEFEKYLENEGIPIENNFDVSGNKIYFSFWGIILLLPIITAITQTIGNVLFK